MTDWTTCRVVRDRDGDLWFRGCDSDDLWTANTNYPDVFLSPDELGVAFGPLTPVLDADGLPVVRTVGDLTARHQLARPRIRVAGREGKLKIVKPSDAYPGTVTLIWGDCWEDAAHPSPHRDPRQPRTARLRSAGRGLGRCRSVHVLQRRHARGNRGQRQPVPQADRMTADTLAALAH